MIFVLEVDYTFETMECYLSTASEFPQLLVLNTVLPFFSLFFWDSAYITLNIKFTCLLCFLVLFSLFSPCVDTFNYWAVNSLILTSDIYYILIRYYIFQFWNDNYPVKLSNLSSLLPISFPAFLNILVILKVFVS